MVEVNGMLLYVSNLYKYQYDKYLCINCKIINVNESIMIC